MSCARAGPTCAWDRLLFSAKEAVYKAWFPLTRRWLDFEEADVTIDPDGRFTARVLAADPSADGHDLSRLTGRWLARDGLVLAVVVVPAAPR